MSKHARLSVEEHAVGQKRVRVRGVARPRTRYFAFLSYSHDDEEIADWLHRELETFRVPNGLAGRLTEHGAIPRRLTPIFRDRHELSAADDLADEIEAALATSQFLIVLCSPAAARSRWTNAEVESFKRTRPDGCVLAVIASGEPFASDMPGREAEECFPPALRYKYDRRGRPTNKRAEPLAADLRGGHEERRIGLLKLIAGMLGVGLDELVQRETTRRHRHLGWLAAASLAGMAVTSTLAVTAIHARDAAREQRREAEGLIGFMLGDLREKLEPIGKLDALDGVGTRVLNYYHRQDTSQLADAGLSQRSRALSLMAEVATARGDSKAAFKLYREAMAGTAESVRRNPEDPQRLFDHAQNIFYVGQLASRLGDDVTAEAELREYKRLANRMVSIAPDNMKWRMEVQYADTNLGVVLYGQRRFAEAETQFQQALKAIEAFAAMDPKNPEYQKSLADSLAWLADAQMSQGKLGQALILRERHVNLLRSLESRSDDVGYRQRAVSGEYYLGDVYSMLGQNDRALQHYQAAVGEVEKLVDVEPANSLWLEFAFKARLRLGYALLSAGQKAAAAAQIRLGCVTVQRVLAKDNNMPIWRAGLRDCWILQAKLSIAERANDQALQFARRAIAVARTVKGIDPGRDAVALGSALRLAGDANAALGDKNAAQSSWTDAAAALPRGLAERPEEQWQRQIIYRRLGRSSDAQAIASRLQAIGYRNTEPGDA